MAITVDKASGDELAQTMRYLGEHWGAPLVISRLLRRRAEFHPGLVAWEDGDPVGLLTYALGGGELEIVSVDATRLRRGIGSALVTAAIALARESGCRKVWLVTTNDNTGAMAFYRAMGFSRVAVRKGAVDMARALNPAIPKVWKGMEVRDEHEFELRLVEPTLEGALADRIGAALGSRVSTFRSVRGGYSPATRVVVTLRDGRAAYVKSPNAEEQAQWLRAELEQYSRSLACMPAVLFGDDGAEPLLILEDLSDGHWPPDWRPGDVDAVRAALHEVSAQPAGELPRLASGDSWANQWQRIKADPAAFLRLGLCAHDWFHDNVDRLIEAEAGAVLDGDALAHCDVRSDNICLRDGRAYLIDWNWACAAHPTVDLAFWAPSLVMEGGPPPEELAPNLPGMAAKVAGFFALRAGLPTIPEAPRVRAIQHAQLTAALPWAARALGISMEREWL